MTEEIKKEDIAPVVETDSSDEAETQVYELGFHIVSSVDEDTVATEVSALKSLIETNGGVFIADGFPKLINLAYEITKSIEGKNQKFDTAYFGWIKFETKADDIIKIKEGVDLNKNILRYLIIKTVKESTLPSKNTAPVTEDVSKKENIRLETKTDQKLEEKPASAENNKDKQEKMTEAELDKTIEELIVE